MVAHLAIQDSHRSVCYLPLRRFLENREAETSVRLCVARRWVEFNSRRAALFFAQFATKDQRLAPPCTSREKAEEGA
jgi:hypothetical protein